MVKYVSAYLVYTSKRDQQMTYLMMFMRSFFIIIYFIQACVVGIHLNCIDKSSISTQNVESFFILP